MALQCKDLIAIQSVDFIPIYQTGCENRFYKNFPKHTGFQTESVSKTPQNEIITTGHLIAAKISR